VLQVETEILEDRQARLIATVEPERVEKEKRAAAQRIAKKANIPGFRKGKAPYHIISRYFGEVAIFEEALDPLGQSVYKEALEASGLEPYAPGVLSDFTLEPVVFTFTVPLMPEIDMGSYRDVRVDYVVEQVTDEDVKAALQNLRDQHATLDPVERDLQMGDVALLDIVGTLVRDEPDEPDSDQPRNDTWLNREGVRVKINEEATYPVPGFPSRVLGMRKDDRRSFDISFAEDEAEVAETLHGKTLHFEVRCAEIYQYSAPEIDDEFARELDNEYASAAELERDVRSRLEQTAARMARDSYLARVIDHLLESTVTVKFPPVMVENQIDDMVEEFERTLRRDGMDLEDYLRMRGMDSDTLRGEMHDDAMVAVSRGLLLGTLAEAEQLKVSDGEIDDEIETTLLPYGGGAGILRQFFSSPESRQAIRNRLLTDKAIARLLAIAQGTAPEIGAEEVQPPADESADEPQAETSPDSGETAERVQETPTDGAQA
jgi:trigger factor